jgi:hypothetical protein
MTFVVLYGGLRSSPQRSCSWTISAGASSVTGESPQ